MVRTACQSLLVAVVVLCPALATPGWTQPMPAAALSASTSPSQVISGNPFGFVIDLVNGEYERRAGNTVSVGAGASRGNWGAPSGRDYVNGDIFVRYYPGGRVFEGRSFGIKAGMTRFPGSGRLHLGVGVDANQTWMLGPHFALSTGFGLKRLIGMDAHEGPRIIPTLRFNVGVAF